MAGIFPSKGRAPGVNNDGVDFTVVPVGGCEPLYYDELCPGRIDPKALNALMSEFVNLMNCKNVQYDCTRFDNLSRALCPSSGPGPGPGVSGRQIFDYVGGDQHFTIPAGMTRLRAKGWGGGGGVDNAFGTVEGGGGGFFSFDFNIGAGASPIMAGSTITIVVGRGGCPPFAPYNAYGFGGLQNDPWGGGGGGLSGIFVGSGAVGASDLSRALGIAGGGGGGDVFTGGSGDFASSGVSATHHPGGPGGGGGSGSQSTFQGQASAADAGGSPSSSSGGGGWRGGAAGGSTTSAFGGSSMVATGLYVTSSLIIPGTGRHTPNQSDSDYVTGIGMGATAIQGTGGNGRIVLEWS